MRPRRSGCVARRDVVRMRFQSSFIGGHAQAKVWLLNVVRKHRPFRLNSRKLHVEVDSIHSCLARSLTKHVRHILVQLLRQILIRNRRVSIPALVVVHVMQTCSC